MTSQRDSIRTATSSSFSSEVLNGAGPIVVEFMSFDCGHCQLLEPVLQDVARRLGDEETIFRVDTAVAQDLTSSYQIDGTSTRLMFLDGNEVGRVTGPQPVESSLFDALTEPFRD